MKKVFLLLGVSAFSTIQMWAQCALNVNAQSSCPPPNCNGIITATPVGCSPPYTFTLISSAGSVSVSSTPFFTNLCPDSYTIAMMDGLGNFTGTSVAVQTTTSNAPYITNVTYTPAPVPPYQPFQYIATATYTNGTSPYTITWFNYSVNPPLVITTHTSNTLQDTLLLYPGDYGVVVTDNYTYMCPGNSNTYTFSICDNGVGSASVFVQGAINSNTFGPSPLYTVCANSTYTVNFVPMPFAPVSIVTVSAGGTCNGSFSTAITYTCSTPIGVTETVSGSWGYSMNCPAINAMALIYTDACLSTPMNINTEQFLMIYPNPTKDKVSISSASNISDIEIYDAIGNIYLANKTDNSNEWDIQHLSNGVYFIKIHLSNNNTLIKRFVVQK